MLRDGADIHAEVKPFGVTPLSIAQDLAAAARPVIQRAFLHGFAEILAPGVHNALLVLEAAKPWSRKTHTLFPAPARARAADLMRAASGSLLPSDFPIPFELWETFVMPHAVTRDYKPPPPPPPPPPPRRSARIAGRTKTPPPTHAAYKRAARCLAPVTRDEMNVARGERDRHGQHDEIRRRAIKVTPRSHAT